ncbi:MAG: hypothetical protein RIR00_1606 [Pseudomonadota bacterium]|jgi:uncharacterized protein YfaS (alpha-2-macroglobulin family)
MVAACLLAGAGSAGAFSVQRFSPEGQVSQQTRVSVRFSADMVRLGDTTAAAPFDIQCGSVNGEGRWQDSQTWSWQWSRPLQAGEQCRFELKAGLTAINGEAASGRSRFEFAAAAPRAWGLQPRPGATVEEDQVFVVNGGGPLALDSVRKNLWCEASGVGQRIPVQIVEGPPAQEVLQQVGHGAGPAPVLVRCSEMLPAGAKLRLVWGKGITASNGTPSQKEESFNYSVRLPFRAEVSCEREKLNAPCSPLSGISVNFNAPIDVEQAMRIRLQTPEGSRSPRKAAATDKTVQNVLFPAPLSPQAELRLELPGGLKDEAGRSLANAASFPLTLRSGGLPPLAKFPGNFGILELKEGGVLPVTLRNVEASLPQQSLKLPGSHRFSNERLSEDGDVLAAMRALARFEQQTQKVKLPINGKLEEFTDFHYPRELSFLQSRPGVNRQALPKPGGSNEFEVVGIPLGKPGLHIVEIESRLLGAALLATPKPMYVRTSVLVTNLAVHFKRGRDNALVWVTALDSGKPVGDAEVRVSRCDGTLLWQGRTDAQGRALAEQPLQAKSCDDDNFLFVSARLGEDYSFARSDWNEGIEPWRFAINGWADPSPLRLHSVLDRSLFRLGETLSMKHFARRRDSRGFALLPPENLPTQVVITHRDSGNEYKLPLTWNAQGDALSQWKIPASAKLGSYDISLNGGKREPGQYEGAVSTGEFRVSDFRLPVFTGSVKGVPGRQVAPDKVPLALGLSFLNGGAAKETEVQVSATLRPRWPSYPNYEAYSFQLGFADSELQAFGLGSDRQSERLVLDKQALKLDRNGSGKLDVALPQAPQGPSELYAEMSFPDPNGEIQTLRGRVELWTAKVTLGLKIGDGSNGQAAPRLSLVTLDMDGKPVAGQDVVVKAKRRINYSHRRRIVGGFYAYEHSEEFRDLGEICRGRSDSRGFFECTPDTMDPGSVYVLAETRDSDGRPARAGGDFWIYGAGDTWFTAGNQDRIDLIPEQTRYQPGQTARFQVRTPFREATALVSVEAEGVIDSYVLPISRFKPVIELPVKAEWGPNVFVSALLVRGRVEPLNWLSFFQWGWREPISWFREWWNPQQPTAMVDLAKPAFRLGLTEIQVGTEGFRLQVTLTPDRTDYKPRDEATVTLQVNTPDGKPAAGGEVTFAAVDQALLELRGNDSWNLLEAMLTRRGHSIETATAQSQVIGKRHFGKKALPPGGGGGRAPARELFDTLLSWQPAVKLDANGSARLRFRLNDSLSEFQLVGVASRGSSQFGTGSTRIRSRQDLQLISGLPPLVREGDSYRAMLTLRNGTARRMTLKVEARQGSSALPAQNLTLEPESAGELAWNVKAAEGISSQNWEFSAREDGGNAGDTLRISQQIAPAVPVTVQQASFQRLDGKLELPVSRPAGALPGKGGLEINLAARLATPPAGLRRFFESYPYGCLEQLTSIAIGLHDEPRWQQIVSALPGYLDSNGLARYFPGDGPGSTTLTAYLLDLSSLAGWSLPEDSRQKMLQGLRNYVEGRFKAQDWAPAGNYELYRRLNALASLSRYGQNVARSAAALEVDPLRLPTSALIDWNRVLQLQTELPQRETRLAATRQELRNRLTYAGTRLVFSNEREDYWWWMMLSADANAFRLIDAVFDAPDWQDDLPRLLQGALERQVRGHWLTTTANAWARVMLDRFASKFERSPVSGQSRASLAEARAALDWKTAGDTPAALALPWPASKDATLQLEHQGSGKPWATIQVLAAIPDGPARGNGLKVSRKLTPLSEKTPGKVSRGDLWRVTLTLDSDLDLSWVALSDPIPAGARILGDGDGRDSQIATLEENRSSRGLLPTYVERSFAAYRAYYALLPRGRTTVEYTLRLNNSGNFALPATRAEAMYAPDIFSEAPNGRVVVE